MADRDAILSAAQQRLATATQALTAAMQQVETGLDRHLAGAEARLTNLWTTIVMGANAARERTGTLGGAAAQALGAVLSGAPAALLRHDQQLRRTLADGLDRAWRALGRHNGGTALLAACDNAATIALDRQASSLARLWDGLIRDVVSRFDVAEAGLARASLVIDSHDPTGVLRRGFVLVTDAAGRVLPTRIAAAIAHGRVSLLFSDGTLNATIDAAGPGAA